ncbi:gamma carbonic anhydrase family protein [Epibacterium sp. SM1969]|uniref:Gamma carbonic anhydrase family protein n=1 Tax=Tritonibacter aquimaris TaxID=2663379 RepID=A0A844ASA2_9RHOB|nr:gamma carbonic anhydrase family protein [Tritonibacter aquimaris]MQY43963.1 gamma carbonic anhydrase family protein [Tritonibacter aquimaris]
MNALTNLYRLGDLSPSLPENGDYWIAPDARVIGQVSIGEGSSIWWGCVLRGDNELIVLGKGSNIQEHCVLHVDPGYPLTIGANCTIGHKAMLHGCTIGDGSLIGMGATVLNGAKIGKNCLIGAGALVTEGAEIPDGSLVVGMPAKVKRQLSDEAIANLAKSAEKYRWNKDQFRTQLEQI